MVWYGTVNLVGCLAYEHGLIGRGGSPISVLGHCGRARDLSPGGEPVGHFAVVLLGGELVMAGPKMRGDATEGG